MKQVSINVYVNIQPYEKVMIDGANTSFVTTTEGIVMIDTPYLPKNVPKWREEIASRGEVRFIINTEHHRDHATGNYFFPGAVVSSQLVREQFRESLVSPDYTREKVRELDPSGPPLPPDYQIKPPAIAFLERMNLYLGDHVFQLMHLPGHTPGQVAVYVPGEKVVFTGDNFANGWQPSLRSSCPLEWVQSLKTIEALDFEIAVPGHGGLGDRKAVTAFRTFIEECIDTVRKAIKRGMSRDEAIASITFETRQYPPALHPGAEQQRLNVARLYEMLSKTTISG